MKRLHEQSGGIKGIFCDPTAILAAAYDGNDTRLMAAGIIGHPCAATLLERRSIKRLFDIAYADAAPSRTDNAFIRTAALSILVMAQVAS